MQDVEIICNFTLNFRMFKIPRQQEQCLHVVVIAKTSEVIHLPLHSRTGRTTCVRHLGTFGGFGEPTGVL